MSCAIDQNQWHINGAQRFAPSMIGALGKINGALGCAVDDFSTAHQWRNGAKIHLTDIGR